MQETKSKKLLARGSIQFSVNKQIDKGGGF